VEDGKVLYGLSMTVLETAVGHAVGIELPTSPDDADSVGRRPASLLEAIERESSFGRRDNIRQLFYLEVFGLLLDFHDMCDRGCALPKEL
jgi:hypothetical protein